MASRRRSSYNTPVDQLWGLACRLVRVLPLQIALSAVVIVAAAAVAVDWLPGLMFAVVAAGSPVMTGHSLASAIPCGSFY